MLMRHLLTVPSHACGEKRNDSGRDLSQSMPSHACGEKLGIQPHEDDTVSAFSRVRRKTLIDIYSDVILRCLLTSLKKTYYLLSDLLNCDAFSGGERRRYTMLSGFLISARSKFSKRYHVPSLFCLNTIGRGLSAPLERM